MRIFILENDSIKITFSDIGAEIKSALNKKSDYEFIWQGDPSIWPRSAPNLFPIVGKLKDGKYRLDEKFYSMNQHGFARDSSFDVTEKENILIFRLCSNEKTKEIYPFDFSLYIIYTLTNNVLNIKYSIENNSKDNMYFSIGAHPGFNVDVNNSTLKFNSSDQLNNYIIDDGLIEDKYIPMTLNNRELKLNTSIFDSDAIVLKDINLQSVSLKDNTNNVEIKVSLNNFNYLGIWTKEHCNDFLCIEPWNGIADSTNSEYDFKNKEGINILKPNQVYECDFNIEFEHIENQD